MLCHSHVKVGSSTVDMWSSVVVVLLYSDTSGTGSVMCSKLGW